MGSLKARRVGVREMRMLRYCLEEHRTNENTREEENVINTIELIRKRKLDLLRNVCQRDENEDMKRACEMRVCEMQIGGGRPKHKWEDTTRKDVEVCYLKQTNTQHMIRWKRLVAFGFRQVFANHTEQGVNS